MLLCTITYHPNFRSLQAKLTDNERSILLSLQQDADAIKTTIEGIQGLIDELNLLPGTDMHVLDPQISNATIKKKLKDQKKIEKEKLNLKNAELKQYKGKCGEKEMELLRHIAELPGPHERALINIEERLAVVRTNHFKNALNGNAAKECLTKYRSLCIQM